MMHFFKFATLVALLLRTTSAQTSSVTNRIEIVKDLQFQLIGDAAQGAKAQKVASDGRITGPATIVLDGLAGGSAYKCNFIAPFTGFQTTDWYTNIRSHRSSDAGGPLVMDCGQDQLDPESGPYLTLYPDGVKLRLDKRPGLELFDGATIGSFDKTTEHISGATFKGVAYMKWPWDNIGFTVITQRFSYSCVVGTRDGHDQTKDVVFCIREDPVPADQDKDSIGATWPIQDNVGVRCKRA
ncbi:uncharacterized protein MKK02DRAFT_40735 [Dioszegia hungarica]|uniref:Uncharacterized protein n=1 Tax=Dioszegia hungarica TaxID=4972 RepID=A0AA38H0C7_9TREE|nr:uncharacterized protein MKK02DRAFT_40735 [Dioszegia hungarica]KAI9632432.1 hypothetical protein MKK02DRAFT_40735 [Dioszegia hungarica]